MSVIVKSGGGKSGGLYIWKKYEVIHYLSFIGNEEFTLKTNNNTKIFFIVKTFLDNKIRTVKYYCPFFISIITYTFSYELLQISFYA